MLELSIPLFLKVRTCGITDCVWDTSCKVQSSHPPTGTFMRNYGLINPLSFWLNRPVDLPDALRGRMLHRFREDDMKLAFLEQCPEESRGTSLPNSLGGFA